VNCVLVAPLLNFNVKLLSADLPLALNVDSLPSGFGRRSPR